MRLAAAMPVSGQLFPPWRTLLLTLLALALYLGAGPAPAGLVLDRAGLGAGEWWRLFAAHWAHSDAEHALWNIAALAFLGALFERRLGWRMHAALALGMLSVSLWVVLGLPQVQRYCGLSGILNSLLAAGLVAMWRDTRDPLVLLVAAGAVLKIVVETALGQALFTSATWASVPTAHAAGFIAGLVATWSSPHAPSPIPLPSRDVASCQREGRRVACRARLHGRIPASGAPAPRSGAPSPLKGEERCASYWVYIQRLSPRQNRPMS